MENREKAHETELILGALRFVIPLLEKYGFRWVITGGFAAYAYGVDRPLTDIDIDVDASVHDRKFQDFLAEILPCTTQPILHFVDEHYDDYSVEITHSGIVVDICPMAEMNLKNARTGQTIWIYQDGFPEIELVDFGGLKLPLLAKSLLIQQKRILMRDEYDERDIKGLEK